LFTLNNQDGPAGFLPGDYSNITNKRFNKHRHRSYPPLYHHLGDYINRYTDEYVYSHKPNLLFSFRGSESALIRKIIFLNFKKKSDLYKVTQTYQWYDHNKEQKEFYLSEILDSKFVLCPSGISPFSPRIMETMASGRVPVMIADQWRPFDKINFSECGIIIKEEDINNITDILLSREKDYEMLSHNARGFWKKYFSPQNSIIIQLDLCREILESRPDGFYEKEFQKMWTSRKFYKMNGWTLEQRLISKLKRVLKNFNDKINLY